MSRPENENPGDTTNTAESGSYVGAQFGHVHNSEVYVVGPDEPPETKYRFGLLYLREGVPAKARELITEAVSEGHDNSETRFHQVLAVLSKRSFRDLGPQDREQLRVLSARLHTYSEDVWRRALESVLALLSCLDKPGRSSDEAVDTLLALPEAQRRPVLHHLGLMVTGGMRGRLWQLSVGDAEATVDSGDRADRVWAYFEPRPAGARVKEPDPSESRSWDLFWSALGTVLVAVCLAPTWWTALVQGGTLVVLSCLIAPVVGYAALHDTFLWWHRNRLHSGRDLKQLFKSPRKAPPKGGFAHRVDQDFEYYFTKYAPDGSRRGRWLSETAKVRRSLRDEVVHIYRESEVGAGSVRWLIRYMAIDTRDRSRRGSPLDPRSREEAPGSLKLRAVLFSAIATATGLAVVSAAFSHAWLPTLVYVPLAVVVSVKVLPVWATAFSESWRVREETRERDRIREDRETEYDRWKNKLDRLRPGEEEMESWLHADKTLILDEALKYYELSWQWVIAHAFLHTPSPGCERAKVEHGVWRYSGYVIRVFLVTEGGVREVEAELDFERGRVGDRSREGFPFASVSSLRSEEKGRSYTLYLTLMNGEPKKIQVSEPAAWKSTREGAAEEAVEIDLDASGFSHTRRILEGIAAEGTRWLQEDRDRRNRTQPPDSSDDRGVPEAGSDASSARAEL